MSEQRKFSALSIIICAYLAAGCMPAYALTIGIFVGRAFKQASFAETFVLAMVLLCGLLGITKLYTLASDLRNMDFSLDRLPRIVPIGVFMVNVVLVIVKCTTKSSLLGTILGVECGVAVIWLTFGLWAYFRYQNLEGSHNYLLISASGLRLW